MNNHDFFCECATCCGRYDTPAGGSVATFTDARPLVRQTKSAPVRTRYMKPGQAVGTGKVRKPSEKQLSYLKSLLASRDLTKLMLPRGVDRSILETPEQISLRGCSDLISNLLDCPKKDDAPVRPMTDGQRKYLLSLIEQKYVVAERECMVEFIETLDFKLASKTIDIMQKRVDVPREKKAPSATDLKEGVYRYEGGAARVVCSDSGRMYAGLWNAETQEWGYTPGLIRNIKAEDRMTLEEISAFGQAFGRCGHCNKKLTNKDSMERGIGPKCATMY